MVAPECCELNPVLLSLCTKSIHRILKKHEKSLQKLFQHFAAVEIADEGTRLCEPRHDTLRQHDWHFLCLSSESKQQSSQRKSAAFLHWTFNQYMEFGRELKRHGILEVSCALCAA